MTSASCNGSNESDAFCNLCTWKAWTWQPSFLQVSVHSPRCWPTQTLLMTPNVRHNPRRSLGSSWQKPTMVSTHMCKIAKGCMLNYEKIDSYIFSTNQSKCAHIPELQVLTNIQIHPNTNITLQTSQAACKQP